MRFLLPKVCLAACTIVMMASCATLPPKPSVYRKHDLKAGEPKGTATVSVASNALSPQELKTLERDVTARFAAIGLKIVAKDAGAEWKVLVNHQVKPAALPPNPDGSIPPVPSYLKGSYEHSLSVFLAEGMVITPRWGVSVTSLRKDGEAAPVVPALLEAGLSDFPGPVSQ